jgi:hypothetical protein
MFKHYKILLAIFVFSVLLVSCSKDDPVSNDDSLNTSKLSGNWQVTYYWDSDKDETYKFSGNTFTFASSGSISVVASSNTYTGTWTTGSDDSQTKLYLTFGSPDYLSDISDDWHVIEQTDNKIRLEDVSGGNGGTDLLTFERK